MQHGHRRVVMNNESNYFDTAICYDNVEMEYWHCLLYFNFTANIYLKKCFISTGYDHFRVAVVFLCWT